MLTDYIELRVPKPLYSYIVHTRGSNFIHIGKHGVIWAVVKQYLICYTQWIDEQSRFIGEGPTINIGLLRKNGVQIPNNKITFNTGCRRYLSIKGSRIVVRLLISEFQKTFLDYMSGASAANPELNIKDAINIFCEDYGLDFTSSYEMLKKRWYRYRQKESEYQNTLINF